MPSTAPDVVRRNPGAHRPFPYESGHHGDLWLDLDALFTDPMRTESFAAALSSRLVDLPIEVVCGAMTGGALLAQTVARILGLHFAYTERHVEEGRPVYLLPTGQQSIVDGKRIALVDDVINAGSATRATYRAVVDAGGIPVAIGCAAGSRRIDRCLGSGVERPGSDPPSPPQQPLAPRRMPALSNRCAAGQHQLGKPAANILFSTPYGTPVTVSHSSAVSKPTLPEQVSVSVPPNRLSSSSLPYSRSLPGPP